MKPTESPTEWYKKFKDRFYRSQGYWMADQVGWLILLVLTTILFILFWSR